MINHEYSSQLKKINKLKKENTSIKNFSIFELQKLPILSGVINLNFYNKKFLMLNIENDDGIVLKYLWRDQYEPFSLKLWYLITREDSIFFDIGAHTGIYSIIGNINKKLNNIISVEPYYLNFARLICNLQLNKISAQNCFMYAISNLEGAGKFKIIGSKNYLTQGGKLDKEGNFSIPKQIIDNFKLDKKIGGIKIDTEGHELECLLGGKKIIKKNFPDIILEINKKSFEGSYNFLKSMGYQIYMINEKNEDLKIIDYTKINFENIEGTNALASTKNISVFEKNIGI
jgi:FkbM family methyltransferase